jgi:alpha/beta superfamily hydrolase
LAHQLLGAGQPDRPVSQPIRANSVLPAARTPVTLHTADGLALVGELALPEQSTAKATLICLHPLPTHGGSMDSHLLRKMAWRLPALADIAVLRFNTRGTASDAGQSQGSFDGGNGERYDVAAAIELVDFEGLPAPWLVGWSFGTDLALLHGLDPTVLGAILLAPPLKLAAEADLQRWAQSGKPVVAIVPEFDDYLRPDEARHRLLVVPQAEVVPIAGARHLFVGRSEEVLDEIVRHVNPAAAPLPDSWPGPG